jgi:hypothetical protein
LELAAESREVAQGKSARWTSTSPLEVQPPIDRGEAVRHETKHAGGGSQAEERHGLAAGVLRIGRRLKSPVRRGSVEHFRTQHILRTAPRSLCSTNPSPSRYPIIDRLSYAVCLWLSRWHTARTYGPLTTQTTGGRYGRVHHDHNCARQHAAKDRGMKELWHGGRSAGKTPYAPIAFSSSQPPKEEGSLG